MIKLVKNELIKIYKRKSIYLLYLISIIVIFVFNNINPDQNKIYLYVGNTKNVPIESEENILEKINKNIEYGIDAKVSNEFFKLYNSFKVDSWQRYALNEERTTYSVNGVYTDYNLDIHKYLKNIYDYELNPKSEIMKNTYEMSKIKYNEYVKALRSDNWKEYVSLKIKNLEEIKSVKKFEKDEIEEINFEIELYKLRLNNDINFDYNMLNQYLQEYKANYYTLQVAKINESNENKQFVNKNINSYTARMNLCKYAIENNIEYDISNEINLISNNKIDARISLIRTFSHFDLIIVIIIIYIGSTIVTEEINKKTIKNLLTKPYKRSKILVSKILASFIVIIISMIVITVLQFIIGGIIFGFDSYNIDYIGYNYNSKNIFKMNLFDFVILLGLTKLPMYIIIALFCIFIGIINKHTAMSMIITLAIFLISSTLLAEWSKVDALSAVTRYFVTTNWDFSTYLFGQISDISGVTLYGSIINCTMHYALLLMISIYFFNKKEIM